MPLDSKEERIQKMDYVKVKILKMMGNEYVSAKDIAEIINRNEKTVRKYITEMNDLLEPNGAIIVSKQGKGFFLDVFDQSAYEKFAGSIGKSEITQNLSLQTRVAYIAQHLILNQKETRKEELINFLFVSNNTLTADLKSTEEYLNKFDLQLRRLPGVGLNVFGNEYNIRVCLLDNLRFAAKISAFWLLDSEINEIKNSANRILQENQIAINGELLKDLYLQIEIAVLRSKSGNHIHMYQEAITFVLNKKISNVSKEIVTLVNQALNATMNEDDEKVVGLNILTKVSSYSFDRENLHYRICNSLDLSIERMLDHVNEEYSIDLKNNTTITNALFKHLFTMNLRILYKISIQNPILEELKKSYSFSFAVAKTAAEALEEYYQLQISDDEIGYLCMIFSLAIDHSNTEITKKNIVFVCSTGTASSKFYRIQFETQFSSFINQTYECTSEDIKCFDFEGKDIDFVFTTVPIAEDLPVPIIETNLLIEKHLIPFYKNVLLDKQDAILEMFYKKENFIANLDAQSKEEVILQMVNKFPLDDTGKKRLFDSIMEREQKSSTDLSGIAATPHPLQLVLDENMIVIATLKNPVQWGKHSVRLVILVNLKKGYDKNVETFYQKTTSLLFDDKKVSRLVLNPSYENLMNLLSD